MSSLPGHTPSSQGSSSSSESLISSEPSDSGFHSVSTGEHRRLHKIHGSHAHRQAHQLRSGHSPREQRGRWDLESIPETTLMTHPGAPQSSRCTVGNSTTTTVHFHRAERSPTLPRHRSPPSPSIGKQTCMKEWILTGMLRYNQDIELIFVVILAVVFSVMATSRSCCYNS